MGLRKTINEASPSIWVKEAEPAAEIAEKLELGREKITIVPVELMSAKHEARRQRRARPSDARPRSSAFRQGLGLPLRQPFPAHSRHRPLTRATLTCQCLMES
jgi:hypothetical protein